MYKKILTSIIVLISLLELAGCVNIYTEPTDGPYAKLTTDNGSAHVHILVNESYKRYIHSIGSYFI